MVQGDATKRVHEVLAAVHSDFQRKGAPLQLLLCVLPTGTPNNATYLYPTIKRWGNSICGVPSQCVQARRVRDATRLNVSLLSNLILKINLKLGGHNVHPGPCGLSLVQDTPTMVLGADVHHGSPGSKQPSYAAVVASVDRVLASYHTCVSAQPAKTELIEQIGVGVYKGCIPLKG